MGGLYECRPSYENPCGVTDILGYATSNIPEGHYGWYSSRWSYPNEKESEMERAKMEELFAGLYPNTSDFILVDNAMGFDQETFAIARLDTFKFLETARIIADAKAEAEKK